MIPGRGSFVFSLNGSPFNNGTLVYVQRPHASKITKPELGLRFIPAMITRLMLSLKKSAAPQEDRWSLGEPTVHSSMRFAERRGSVITRDEIHLDTFASMHEGAQSQT